MKDPINIAEAISRIIETASNNGLDQTTLTQALQAFAIVAEDKNED